MYNIEKKSSNKDICIVKRCVYKGNKITILSIYEIGQSIINVVLIERNDISTIYTSRHIIEK